jgi:hypothetical protein
LTPPMFEGPGVGEVLGDANANPGASAITIASTAARLTIDERLAQGLNPAVVTGSPVLFRADVNVGLLEVVPLQPIPMVGGPTKLPRWALA